MAAFNAEDMKRYDAEQKSAEPAPNTSDERKWMLALAEVQTSQSAEPAYSPVVLAGFVRLLDFTIVLASGFFMDWLYLAEETGHTIAYLVAIPSVAACAVIIFQALGINNVGAFRHPINQGLRLAGGLALVFLGALAIVFFAKLEGAFSRVWLLSWFALSIGGLMIERGVVSVITRRLTRIGRLDRRVAVVGGGPSCEQLLTELASQKDNDLRIYGVFDDRLGDRSQDVVAGFPKLGTVDDLVVFARHARLDLVIFAMPITAEQRLLQMLRKLWVLPVDIRLAAHSNQLRFRPRSYSYVGSVPVLDVFDKPIADWDVVLKSAFDRVVGALLLLLLSPLFLIVAAAIKLDSKGPVFFRQKRYGFNNELVEIFKFRSMYVDDLDHTAAKLVTKDDPRVTRVGRFIRKASIDELPQLFNVVFSGNLSLVGPRPHAVHAKAADRKYDEVVDGYFARHRVRPGITGWAQINGWRGETDTQEKLQNRVEHDLYYIENWSIAFDLYILAMTPFALLKAENAY
jgi:Undecaprenyl-phosphate glucose phosphotransferase